MPILASNNGTAMAYGSAPVQAVNQQEYIFKSGPEYDIVVKYLSGDGSIAEDRFPQQKNYAGLDRVVIWTDSESGMLAIEVREQAPVGGGLISALVAQYAAGVWLTTRREERN